MDDRYSDCKCSILNAREEKLLDDDDIQVRLICNRCGAILDSHTISSKSAASTESPSGKEAAGGR
jgi:hypothetical protein